MITSQRKKRGGVVGGCIVPIVALAGFFALCYMVCFILYSLNASILPGGSNSTGGMLLQALY